MPVSRIKQQVTPNTKQTALPEPHPTPRPTATARLGNTTLSITETTSYGWRLSKRIAVVLHCKVQKTSLSIAPWWAVDIGMYFLYVANLQSHESPIVPLCYADI